MTSIQTTVTIDIPDPVVRAANFPPTSLTGLHLGGTVSARLCGVANIGRWELPFAVADHGDVEVLFSPLSNGLYRYLPSLETYMPEGVDALDYADYLVRAILAVEESVDEARKSVLAAVGEQLAAAAL